MTAYADYILVGLSGTKIWTNGDIEGDLDLEDMAVALYRESRFAGHTVIPWNVLSHSIFVVRILGYWIENPEKLRDIFPATKVRPARLLLRGLLHDLHEAVTSDTPSPFKTAGMRKTQDTLDASLFAALRERLDASTSWDLSDEEETILKMADTLALCIEGCVFTPTAAEWIPNAFTVFSDLGWTLEEYMLGPLLCYPVTLASKSEEYTVAQYLNMFSSVFESLENDDLIIDTGLLP